MYLKSIEVHGFKSFANKITFQFHNGITGIVGPNGSGKSNVADAVRWVLGEQKIKQLRGATMQDVIFSGTETRKPIGYAYVAITLDNTDHQLGIDYDEVTVARRIFRSGESEYLINGNTCRLRDVSELFYDTGIGKEGYSIIGQGQIDKILSGRPEERRELFDEAAGIVKFKKRKSVSLKKLEDEKQNLLRVKDILGEIEKQVKPLEKQSETAKVFLKKKDELKTLDVNMFLLEHNRIQEQLSVAKEKHKIAVSDLKDTKDQYEKIKIEYDELEGQLESLEVAMEEARQSLSETSQVRAKLENEKSILQEQIYASKASEEHLRSRLLVVQKELEEQEKNKAQLVQEQEKNGAGFLEIEALRNQMKEELLQLQAQIAELNEQIEQSKNKIIQSLNDRASIRSQMGSLEAMIGQSEVTKASLTARLVNAQVNDEEQELYIKSLEDIFLKVTNEIEQWNQKQGHVKEEIDVLKHTLSEKDQMLRDKQEIYHKEKTRLETLSNIAERYEGYGGSVKKVMEQRENIPGIVGVVADIIKVDKKYEVAMETALGGNIQNIVTENEIVAKKMIQFLKDQRGGRATFLPLTSIMKPQVLKNKEVLEEVGVLGLASTLVRIEEKYKNVAMAMLGRIVVVDHIDHAIEIAKKYNHEIRLVTLEGELFVPGGAISGGAFKNNSNLLGRRRELEFLEANIAKTWENIQALETDIENAKDKRNQMRRELETINSEIQNGYLRQNTARMNVIGAKEKKEEAINGAENIRKEARELESQVLKMKEEKETIIQQLQVSEQVEKEMDALIATYQQQLDEKKLGESEQTVKLSEQEVLVEKNLQIQGFEKQNMDRIDVEINRYQAEREEIQAALTVTANDIAQREQNIVEIGKTIQLSHGQQSDVEVQLQKNQELKEVLGVKRKQFFGNREELAEKMAVLDKETYRMQSQVDKYNDATRAQIDYMWYEYEITLHDATTMRNPEMVDLTQMKRDANSLKDDIKKLGNVNVNAIEEYKELLERYTFLKQQHDDLVESEAILEGIITELDQAMKKQFQEKFGEISSEFDKVFKELFGGGKGTLELMDHEDMLEAGIRIIAQPPGKKLQNMMQLSGGEKALTAISLLFAIQNLKPSPFCLLDEIEAALDESNVTRFAKYLNKLTKNTQFIVITHRRGTMEKADRLYGITMKEKGVSTLVSVNLIEEGLDK